MESAQGLSGPQRPNSRPWFSLYKYLHYRSLSVKDNWSRAQPQAVHVLEGHTGLISSLEMSMWTLVTASIDSTIRVWDLRTLQCTQVLHSKQSLTCVAQSESARAACARTSFGYVFAVEFLIVFLFAMDKKTKTGPVSNAKLWSL